MLSAWRIVREKYTAIALSGEGAAEFGGRWNSPGVRVAYTSGSQALAMLELIVHLNPPVVFRYRTIQIEFEERMVQRVSRDELPAGWRAEPPSSSTTRLGDQWAKESRSAVLAVPSAIVPAETNYLINPLHPDFSRIKLGKAEELILDSRLL